MAGQLTSMTFADGNILASRRVPVTTIVINRSEVKNALDTKTARGLAGAFQMADADEEIRAIVVTGAGGSFCSGADLKELASDGMYFPWAGGNDGPLGVPLSKPLIAAVEGPAIGEGLGVALFADIRIIDDSAVFSVASRAWGVPVGDGTTVRLPRLIGMGRALDMLVTGRSVNADEAMAIGLATRKVQRNSTRAEAEKLALQITELPQGAMLSDRRSMYESFDLELMAAIRHETELARAAFGPDAQAAVKSFNERSKGSIRLLRA
jgi:enoyl-CoA hydratase